MTKFVHGPGIDEPLAQTDAAGNITGYFHADGLGSIVKTTNAAGAVTASFDYDAWGNLQSGSATPSPYGFTGCEHDSETGLIYLRARYLDPRSERFISEDPIGFGGGVNFYGYVSGNPVNWTDSTGLWSPAAHNYFFSAAFSGYPGLSGLDIAWMQSSSGYFDSTHQSTSDAFMHSMHDLTTSPLEAIRQRDQFIAERLSTARQLNDQGFRTDALEAFAEAAHTIEDSFSPMHVDEKGMPKWWNPLVAFGHSPNEHIGSERVADITPDIARRVMEALRRAYDQAFGAKGCR